MKKGKPPPPTVKALPGVKPGDIIPKSRLLDEEDPGTESFNWINDPEDDPTYASKEWIETSEEWTQCRVDGSPELQHKIRTLLQKYKKVFSSKLPIVKGLRVGRQYLSVRSCLHIEMETTLQPRDPTPTILN